MNTVVESIRLAYRDLLSESKDYVLIGEGVPDPKACFGTTRGLKEEFPEQVFDMPVSENGMTGVCIGAAIQGIRPLMVHMRVDFLMYAMDQIVNNAAKWHSMFGGQDSVPMVIRAILGRGWGNGPQHSQSLESMFAYVPGLKVFMPYDSPSAYRLMIEAGRDENPVIYMDHRWLHDLKVELEPFVKGEHLTIVTWGHAALECSRALKFLNEQFIKPEMIILDKLRPQNFHHVAASVAKTRRLLVVHDEFGFCNYGSEVVAAMHDLRVGHFEARRLSLPDFYAPASPGLTKSYYTSVMDIFTEVVSILDLFDTDRAAIKQYQESRLHDVPDKSFTGPF